jgi:hypothetical protein
MTPTTDSPTQADVTSAPIPKKSASRWRRRLLAYRAYAAAHPKRYAALPMDPLHDPIQEAAGAKLVGVMYATLRGHGLEGSAAVHATRRLRVLVHGFASIESAEGFGLPEDLDDTYDQLNQMYLASLRTKS